MATLTLTELWLAHAHDPADAITLGQDSEAESVGQPVEVRRRAGGRRVVVRRAGTATVLRITVPIMDRAAYDELKSRVGVTQILRDQRGRIVPGVFAEVNGSEASGFDAVVGVSFTFESVTMSFEA